MAICATLSISTGIHTTNINNDKIISILSVVPNQKLGSWPWWLRDLSFHPLSTSCRLGHLKAVAAPELQKFSVVLKSNNNANDC